MDDCFRGHLHRGGLFLLKRTRGERHAAGGRPSELFQDKGVGIELGSAALCSQFGMQEDFAGRFTIASSGSTSPTTSPFGPSGKDCDFTLQQGPLCGAGDAIGRSGSVLESLASPSPFGIQAGSESAHRSGSYPAFELVATRGQQDSFLKGCRTLAGIGVDAQQTRSVFRWNGRRRSGVSLG